ncbi:N-acetyltransferase [Bacillus sp. REN3]|uniref:GNAT family N-acetyltransferase n=1 Tax=Bacillus sp. REN3 TaxID=2802440 RepID=UPI001AED868C|nr:N-acetyltransferase [Bacillus sp. REN3]
MNLSIRQEQSEDYKLTEQVVKTAFETAEATDGDEHNLVARLRKSDAFIPELSLVATLDEKIIGHVLLTKIKIGDQQADSLALAPVSVLPEHQGKGVGKSLISEAIKEARKLGHSSIIVLGHPDYYPKFGFRKANEWGIKAPFEVPDEVFMALELKDGALHQVSGVVEYSRAFFEKETWQER